MLHRGDKLKDLPSAKSHEVGIDLESRQVYLWSSRYWSGLVGQGEYVMFSRGASWWRWFVSKVQTRIVTVSATSLESDG